MLEESTANVSLMGWVRVAVQNRQRGDHPSRLNKFNYWLVAEEGHYLFAEKFQ